MTYARARLWLGITGVGSWVVLTTIALIFNLPARWFSGEEVFGLSQVVELAAYVGLYALLQTPLDLFGGYLLPLKFQKSADSFGQWFGPYSIAVAGQAILYLLFGSVVLLLGQSFGATGALLAIAVGVVACVLIRNQRILSRSIDHETLAPEQVENLNQARTSALSWVKSIPQTVVVNHRDIGFTGGIIGLGNRKRIVLPESWIEFPQEQLATAIARRAIAINSGSYARGMIVAGAWNLIGFFLCTLMPAAGVASVAGLVTTACWFTLWSFIGLLTLPTVSRNGSLIVDQLLNSKGVSNDVITKTANALDQLQDGEFERPAGIETIFHPVPSVASRRSAKSVSNIAAWNAARTTLFFSWPCLGLLPRAVHCNSGRPELWMMLPSD